MNVLNTQQSRGGTNIGVFFSRDADPETYGETYLAPPESCSLLTLYGVWGWASKPNGALVLESALPRSRRVSTFRCCGTVPQASGTGVFLFTTNEATRNGEYERWAERNPRFPITPPIPTPSQNTPPRLWSLGDTSPSLDPAYRATLRATNPPLHQPLTLTSQQHSSPQPMNTLAPPEI